MEATSRIERLITPSIEAMGYEIVRVSLSAGQHAIVQIMAERHDGVTMTVEDCADISRAVSALLDVEDPLPTAYTLEVSSPGIDRPLTRPKDFERFAGFEARIETRVALDGRKRFRGRLGGLDAGKIRLDTDTGLVLVPVETVQRAKLVLTDELIAATASQH
ncbi:MAG: ribosome maturation factor RimP [Azospirillaceae bacterium]|nr:ribosome maturation factor RimP [Azospirillaceae bacterium]